MRRKWNPGCPCCSCLVFEEHFTDSSWTDNYTAGISDSWAQSDSHISIASDTGTITSKAGQTGVMWLFKLWADVPEFDDHDSSTYTHGTHDLRVKYADADNFIFLRIAWSQLLMWAGSPDNIYAHEWTLRLFERVSGTDTAITDAITYTRYVTETDERPHDWYAAVCVEERDTDDAYYSTDSLEVRSALWSSDDAITTEGTDPDDGYTLRGNTSTASGFGNNHGYYLNAGPISEGIDLIRVYSLADDCRFCDCGLCEHGSSPQRLKVTFESDGPLDGEEIELTHGVLPMNASNLAWYLSAGGKRWYDEAAVPCVWGGMFEPSLSNNVAHVILWGHNGYLRLSITQGPPAAAPSGPYEIKTLTANAKYYCNDFFDGLVFDSFTAIASLVDGVTTWITATIELVES